MTACRWVSVKDVASPVVPSTLSPSQPLARRKRARAIERAQSGSPAPSQAVATAAITPPSLDSFISVSAIWLASAADAVGRERRHVDEISILCGQTNDLHRAVEADQQRPDHGGAAKLLDHFGGDCRRVECRDDQ